MNKEIDKPFQHAGQPSGASIKKLSRREELEIWRAKKGISKKEKIHPLLSRKRSLSKVVSSPSYKPPVKKHNNKENKKIGHLAANTKDKINNRRKTMSNVLHKDLKNIKISAHNGRRNTMTNFDLRKITSSSLPWQDKSLLLKKTPKKENNASTSKNIKVYPKSPISRNLKNVSFVARSQKINTNNQNHQDIVSSGTKDNSDDMICTEEFSKYNDNAGMYSKHEESEDDVPTSKYSDRSLFAITPGRRVHFAVSGSPLQPLKSSAVKFCIIENKNKRVSFEPKTKLMTPVRRSMRLSTSAIPDFLKDSENRIIHSPGAIEDEIIDGEVLFRPNNLINTPLNNGWLIKEEGDAEDITECDCDNDADLSFM